MKSLIKKGLRKLGRFILEDVLEETQNHRSQENQILLSLHYKDLVRRNIKPLPTFDEVGFRCYSQFEDDGILLYIFSLIGTTNKFAVEMGAGRGIPYGIECNTANLIVNHGWQGILFDGSPVNVRICNEYFARNRNTFLWPPIFKQAWITAENINDLLKDIDIVGEIDLFSLDIDSTDYWVWKALDCIQPRVVVCEANFAIGPDKTLTIPYAPDFISKTWGYFGASLAAMSKLASQKGYRLVGTNRYSQNAFFIRNGIGEDLFPSVPVSTCFQHPISEFMAKVKWPEVKDLKWEEV